MNNSRTSTVHKPCAVCQ